jgi:hypothetical protein
MKTLSTTTVALLLIFCTCFSSQAQIAIGPKAGINFNSFRNSKSYRNHFDAIPGFNIGAFAKYPVLDFLTARAEVLYFQQGANIYDYSVMSDLRRKSAVVRFHNVSVPILAEFGLPSLKDDPIKPTILLGGFYSYTLASRETYTNVAKVSGRSAIEYDGQTDTSNQYARGQYGIIGAIAAEVQLFHKPVTLEFRYQYNIPRINKAGTQNDLNLQATAEKWGDELHVHTLSVNVAVTLSYF